MTEATTPQSRAWSRKDVEASLRSILVRSLAVQEAEVVPSAALVRDLGAESIDFLDIGFNVQQTLGVNLQTTDIRTRMMAWASLIQPTLVEIIQERYGVRVTADELRALDHAGLGTIAEYLQTTKGLPVHPGTADELGGALVQRLVKDFAALGFRVNQVDQEDLLALMRTDLSAGRLTERTLDFLTVGALADFICTKMGSRVCD
jgi:acyl carrier protein